MQQEGILEQLAPHLPEEHRTREGLLAVATSAQVGLATFNMTRGGGGGIIIGFLTKNLSHSFITLT